MFWLKKITKNINSFHYGLRNLGRYQNKNTFFSRAVPGGFSDDSLLVYLGLNKLELAIDCSERASVNRAVDKQKNTENQIAAVHPLIDGVRFHFFLRVPYQVEKVRFSKGDLILSEMTCIGNFKMPVPTSSTVAILAQGLNLYYGHHHDRL